MNTCTEEQFLKDVSGHRMTVVKDDGVHRHVIFAHPGSSDMRFELITWPWYLCYTGDMGTYVFHRTEDMFKFFRQTPTGPLSINASYWAEKVEATERDEGVMEYSEQLARKQIAEWLDECDADEEDREAVESEILDVAEFGEDVLRKAVYDFDSDIVDFTDFTEVTLKVYTNRYLWCCYALVWGIRQYDAAKAGISQ